MNRRYICLVLLFLLSCAILCGCGEKSQVRRGRSGELLLEDVGLSASAECSARPINLKSPPREISQLLPAEEGFMLSGIKSGASILRCYDTDGGIKHSYDLDWLEQGQFVAKIESGAKDELYVLTGMLPDEQGYSYKLYTLLPDGTYSHSLDLDTKAEVHDMIFSGGRIYLGCEHGKEGKYSLEVYSTEGELLQSLNMGNKFSLISDGERVFVGISVLSGLKLKLLEKAGGRLTDIESFSGGELLCAKDGRVYFKDKTDVFCYDSVSGALFRPFLWKENGIALASGLCPLSNGDFVAWSSSSLHLLHLER